MRRRRSSAAALLPALALVVTTVAACGDDGDDGPAADGSGSPTATTETSSPTDTPTASPTTATSSTPVSPSASTRASASASATSTPSTRASASASAGKLTTAQAAAEATRIAPSINLRLADLPGFKASTSDDEDDSSDADLVAAAKCIGLTDAETRTLLSDDDEDGTSIDSPDFAKGEVPGLQVNSGIEVATDGGVAAADFSRKYALLFSQRGATCIGRYLASATAKSVGEGATATLTSASTFAVPTRGAQRAGAINAKVVLTVQGEKLPFDASIAFLFQRDTEVNFLALGLGQAFPTSQRTALLTTLSSRLAAAG